MDNPTGGESACLQDRLESAPEEPSPDRPVGLADPVGLFRHLEQSGRFHRDTGLGRIFHPGSVSLRENRATDSLHIVIHEDHISAHVDRVSPLDLRARIPRYSVRRAAAHNLAGMAQDLLRVLRGRQGDHRSELDCQWLWSPPESGPDPKDLLDPSASAWSLHLEVRVTGSLNETRLRQAFAQVVGSRAADHEVLLVIDCTDDACLDVARDQLQAAPVPLAEWPPLRARLARHPGGDVLMLNFNHAASDGFSALHVLRAITRAYADEIAPDPPLEFMALRDLPVGPTSAPVSRLLAWNRLAVEKLRDWLARPARLAPDDGEDDDPRYGFHLVCLSAEDTCRVVDANRPGTSRNKLLAALHLAIGDWNLEHGTPGHRIGVLVQVNLRPANFRDQILGNFSVTARVSTSRRHRSGGTPALEAITSQTTRNKRTRSGIALVAALDRSGLLPLWAKQSLIVLQPLTRNSLIDTAMLTNLGWLDEPPSFGREAGETVDVWFSAPARAPGSLCIGAVTVAGRLHLVIRYPRRILGADAARRFADCYRRQVLLMATTAS